MSKVWVVLVVLALGGPAAWGQGLSRPGGGVIAQAAVPAGARVGLADMAARAAVVFAGHVTQVERGGAGFVDVTFKVDEAVKGCSRLGVYVLREWAGLWGGDAARYRVGDRLLMLLSARGPSGMSAPLNGGLGRIPLAAGGTQPLADARGVAPGEDGSAAADVSGLMVDLRWVQASALRAAYTDNRGGLGGGDAGAQWSGPVSALSGQGGSGNAQSSVAAVLTLLRGAAGTSAGGGHESR